MSRSARQGFTLLEVLIAISILGLGLTVILSAQAGLFSGAQYASNLSLATGLARCRMNELELELLRDGYPLIDQDAEGPCCNDEYLDKFRCTWKIERVELPEAGNLQAATGAGAPGAPGAAGSGAGVQDLAGSLLSPEASGSEGGGGVEDLLSGLSSLSQNPGAQLGASPDLGSLASLVGGAASGSGLAGLAMSLVYPDLKPLLEASIRRVTLTVSWPEGALQRELKLEQFLAFPQQGGFDPLAAEGLNDALDAAGSALGLPGSQPAPGTPPGEARQP